MIRKNKSHIFQIFERYFTFFCKTYNERRKEILNMMDQIYVALLLLERAILSPAVNERTNERTKASVSIQRCRHPYVRKCEKKISKLVTKVSPTNEAFVKKKTTFFFSPVSVNIPVSCRILAKKNFFLSFFENFFPCDLITTRRFLLRFR